MVKIGVDIGGVVVEKDGRSREDTSFQEGAANFVPGALECLAKLVADGHELWVVSFCGAAREEATRKLLRSINFAIPEKRWVFTRSREEKGPVCAKLGLDHFVDDTQKVVRVVAQACPKTQVWWFRGNESLSQQLPNVRPVPDWKQVEILVSKKPQIAEVSWTQSDFPALGAATNSRAQNPHFTNKKGFTKPQRK